LTEEKLPVSETMKVIEAINIFKSDKWWAAVALVESFGRKQLAVYLWNKKENQWKSRHVCVFMRYSPFFWLNFHAEAIITHFKEIAQILN